MEDQLRLAEKQLPGKKLRILVDMDDTIERLLEELVNRANRKFHQHVAVEDVTDWSIAPAFEGITKSQIMDAMNDEGFWMNVDPVPGAAEALKHFMDEGHEVYIVTATEMEHVTDKMRDLLFRCFPFLSWKQVVITRNKQLIRGDVLIDDGIHNLEGGDYAKILFTAPHNRYYDAEANGMIRADSWDEIIGIIDSMALSRRMNTRDR